MNATWKLTDAEKETEAYPETFHIPLLEKRMSLNVGDAVKLSFESKVGYATERMWVFVTDIFEPGKYSGEIDNEALNPNLPRLGELVLFEAKHILATILKQ